MRLVHIMLLSFSLFLSGALLIEGRAAACTAECSGGSCSGSGSCHCNIFGQPKCKDLLTPHQAQSRAGTARYWAADAQIAYLESYIDLLYKLELDDLADSAVDMLEGLLREDAARYEAALDWHEDDACALSDHELEALATELGE